jgi:hypothetical protein
VYTVLFELPPKKKSDVDKSGECGGHRTPHVCNVTYLERTGVKQG